MKILMFNYEFPPIGGGGGWVSYFLGKNFVDLGHQVRLITSQFGDLPKTEMLDGIEIDRVPVLRKSRDVCKVHEMLTYVISSTIRGFQIDRDFQPDIVQVFFGIPSGGGAFLLKKFRNVPYVVFLGGRDVPRPNPDPPYYRWLYLFLTPIIHKIWRNSEAVIACSRGLRELAKNTDPITEISVIPDGIDLARFFSPDRKMDAKCVKILSIGRLIPRKGFQFLIRALPIVRQKTDREFCVEIVGDGPFRSELNAIAENLGVSHLVQFSGSIDYDDLPEKYASADLFTLCSTAEGMPLVALEAMGSGLPIVASRVQGIDELITDGENGFLFAPEELDTLADRLVFLIENDKRRIEMGEINPNRVQPYDWKKIADDYLEIFQRSIRD